MAVRWSRLSGAADGRIDYGFVIGDYDPDLPLIIDPATLVYCGFIGGSASEFASDVAVDGSGNVYVVGTTVSDEATFPVTVGPDLTFNGGDKDVFVAKVRADGSGLDYCGFIGGSGNDTGSAVAVDATGHAYVAGGVGSDHQSFPVTMGPDVSYNGGGDAFVARVSADGSSLDYCGYIGGLSLDTGRGIAVDGTGRAYVVGSTGSDGASFPVTVGPDLSYNGGGSDLDAFVARVAADGSGLEYCGYIGGAAYEYAESVAVDGSGSAFVVGWTESSETSFPVLVGPELIYNGGMSDAFAARVKADGSGLDYCGYVGGASWDEGYGAAVDGTGRAYVVGWTLSDDTFPVVMGPDVTYNGGPWDAFVARVRAGGSRLDYCGYIGGAENDVGGGVAVDGSGSAFVVGTTSSKESTFPVVMGPDLVYNGGVRDGFVTKIEFSDPIFSDGFESGATDAWTAEVP